jgi:ABC-type branched-subunit amino acid transport system substrate-binding protein
VITADVIAEEHILQAPEAFEGIFVSLMKDPSGPAVLKLGAAYQAKFGHPMTLPWFVASAYDGVKLIAGCVEKVGPDSRKVSDCLSKTRGVEGITQTFSFTAGGSSPQYQSIFVVHNKKIDLYWEEQADNNPTPKD